MRRRAALLAPWLTPMLLGACGFAPRRAPVWPWRALALVGFAADDPVALALRQQLAGTPVRVVASPAQADVVLEALSQRRQRSVSASTSTGLVRGWELLIELEYRARTPTGALLLPRTELRLLRELNYTEAAALAKRDEEAQLWRAMAHEAAAQLMRRLATLQPAAVAPLPASAPSSAGS